jgi:hypothetical protein
MNAYLTGGPRDGEIMIVKNPDSFLRFLPVFPRLALKNKIKISKTFRPIMYKLVSNNEFIANYEFVKGMYEY